MKFLSLILPVLVSGIIVHSPQPAVAQTTQEATTTDPCKNPRQEDQESPQILFESMKSASAKHQYCRLCGYFTPAAQAGLVAGSLLQMHLLISWGQEEGSEPNRKKLSKALQNTLEKHDATKSDLPDVDIPLDADFRKQQEKALALTKPIKNRCQFFADYIETLRKHSSHRSTQ